MFPSLALELIVASGLLAGVPAFAGDFRIHVAATLGNRQVATERTDDSPSPKKSPRPVMRLRRDETVEVAWNAENVSKSDELKDVMLHFFVVEEKTAGQPEVPKVSDSAVYEGALTMDFKPREKAKWRLTLKIPEAGNYLLRVETMGLAPSQGHENFAAMDLIVK